MDNYQYWQNPYGYGVAMPSGIPNSQQMNQQSQVSTGNVAGNVSQAGQRQTVARTVAGRDGALSVAMAPNSSEFFSDETAPVIWYVKTDSAGFKSEIVPYPVAKESGDKEQELDASKSRIEDLLERIILMLGELSNAKSDVSSNRSRKSE